MGFAHVLVHLCLVVCLYIVPTFAALWRSDPYWRGIALLNFLLGWTVIAWLVLLV